MLISLFSTEVETFPVNPKFLIEFSKKSEWLIVGAGNENKNEEPKIDGSRNIFK
jgi:hypothetical protein